MEVVRPIEAGVATPTPHFPIVVTGSINLAAGERARSSARETAYAIRDAPPPSDGATATLSRDLLAMLRNWCKVARPPVWLFPNRLTHFDHVTRRSLSRIGGT